MADGGIHAAARVGFGRAADAYERGRPDYPDDAVRWLAETLEMRPAARVMDLAAGTGKLTRMLVPFGAWVVAVEPVEGMRRVFASRVPGVPVVGGRAEALPFKRSSVDGVVVAQAFHWFDPAAALRELHRVLREDGVLALIWNVRDDDASAFWSGLTELLAPYRGDAPAHRSDHWRRALRETDLFGPLETRSFRFEQDATREQAVDRVLSTSFIGALPDAEREVVRTRVLSLFDQAIGPGRDVAALPYRTDVHWARRRPTMPRPVRRAGTRRPDG